MSWSTFAEHAPEIAAAGIRLFVREEVAFLGTTSAQGRPRIHPFVPKIVDTRLVAFILDSSPKINDLAAHEFYAIHASLGPEDEEFYVSGKAVYRNDNAELRSAADVAMGFATGSVDEHHRLYEFLIDRALWTTWENFGTPDHRPNYRRWRTDVV
ncbi:MAG: hypothetical protein O7F71_12200 [Gammaproteobacteria bacterium]|nr:hypothetical protein [Gammaproteobacteria bacterium]